MSLQPQSRNTYTRVLSFGNDSDECASPTFNFPQLIPTPSLDSPMLKKQGSSFDLTKALVALDIDVISVTDSEREDQDSMPAGKSTLRAKISTLQHQVVQLSNDLKEVRQKYLQLLHSTNWSDFIENNQSLISNYINSLSSKEQQKENNPQTLNRERQNDLLEEISILKRQRECNVKEINLLRYQLDSTTQYFLKKEKEMKQSLVDLEIEWRRKIDNIVEEIYRYQNIDKSDKLETQGSLIFDAGNNFISIKNEFDSLSLISQTQTLPSRRIKTEMEYGRDPRCNSSRSRSKSPLNSLRSRICQLENSIRCDLTSSKQI